MTSLRARLAIGAQWTISIRIVDRVIGFASTLILARLLAPEDFGVVAMGTAVHGILASFTEFGFTQSLIRIRRPRPDAYSTAFTLHAVVCAAVALALVSLAPVANAWYGDSRVVIVLLTLAVISLVSGLRNFGMARYERALNFRPFFLMALARKSSSFLAGVGIALLVQDYRALLVGMLVGTVVDVSLTYRLTRFRPRFTLAYKNEVLGFSAWWLASRVVTILGRRGQDLLIGQQFGAAVLGKYAVALDLATMPTVEIVAPVMRAVYPGYMQMKDEVDRLYFAFVKVWGTIALLAIPAAAGVAAVAELLTSVLLGPQWREAAQLMGALAVTGAIEALNSCYWPMLLTRLGPRTVFMLAGLGVCLKLPAFGVALWAFGLIPAIGVWIALSTVMLLLGAKVLLRDLDGSMKPLLVSMVRPIAAAALMAVAVLGAQRLLPPAGSWIGEFVSLLLLVAGGALVYLLSVWGLWRLAGCPASAEGELVALVRARLTRGAGRGAGSG